LPRLILSRGLGLVAGLVAFALLGGLDGPLHHDPAYGSRPAYAAAGAALMAIWWLTEAIPIYWTACLPFVVFPLFGVFGDGIGTSGKALASAYLDPYIFLFAGGMAIAAAMQQWNLHRRIALSIMKVIGSEPKRLLAGSLCATAFISMWISNTATATMMVPIGIALIAQLEAHQGGRRLASFGMAIMLSIAYGANIGGIGTKIGTAPNAQFAGFLERMGTEISFLQFLAVGLPFVLLFLPLAWWALWRMGREDAPAGRSGGEVVARELAQLGPVAPAEKLILLVFGLAAAGWIGGRFLTATLKPWVTAFPLTSAHVEGGVAMLAAFVLLALRSRGRAVLAPRSLKTVPWETLLLLGGGFALAAAVQASGLSAWLSGALSGLRSFPGFTQVLLASLAAVGLSAVASNTATVAVLLVVLKDAVSPDQLHTVLFAVTIAASCDFALPAGTPPNAIVFGSGYVTIPRMARTGFVLDLQAALLAALWCALVVPLVL
jgi:solute carrier family 13 (sodium-dependent dicarboxylate transporter), member 2/3/5